MLTTRKGFRLDGGPTPAAALVGDVWRARSVLAILARKEFFVRYRRASLGLAWAIVLPLVQAIVLSVVVSRFVRFHTGVNYAVFVYSGTLAWNYFSGSLSAGAGAIVDGQDMSTKVYFPRALFPLTAVASGLYGLVLSMFVLLALSVAVGAGVGLHAFLLIPALGLTILLSASFSLVLALLQVYFRDIRYIVQASLIAWFYITPVFYPLRAVGHLRPYVQANPVTGIVELFRAATVGTDPGWGVAIWWTFGWSAALLVLAVRLYRTYDRTCTDLL